MDDRMKKKSRLERLEKKVAVIEKLLAKHLAGLEVRAGMLNINDIKHFGEDAKPDERIFGRDA